MIRAAHYNRMSDLISTANTVAVGAVHAVEAGFSGKQPQALKKYHSSMTRAMKRVATKGRNDKKADADTLFSGFAGTAQIVKGTDGRRKNQS